MKKQLDSEGYMMMSELLNWNLMKKWHVTEDDVREAAKFCQNFEIHPN